MRHLSVKDIATLTTLARIFIGVDGIMLSRTEKKDACLSFLPKSEIREVNSHQILYKELPFHMLTMLKPWFMPLLHLPVSWTVATHYFTAYNSVLLRSFNLSEYDHVTPPSFIGSFLGFLHVKYRICGFTLWIPDSFISDDDFHLSYGNTSNKDVQLVPQHCCETSRKLVAKRCVRFTP